MKLPGNFGMLLLGVWLILYGLIYTPFIGLNFRYHPDVLGILAIVTGVLLLLRR